MKHLSPIVITGLLIWSVSCSSLTFIPLPPTATVATTDYVNKSIDQNIEKTTREVLERTSSILDSLSAAQKLELDQLRQTLESQQSNIQQVLASMEEVNTTAAQIRGIVGRLRNDLNDTKREMMDSLDVANHRIAALETRAQALERSAQNLLNLTTQMQAQITQLPEATLGELKTAIDQFYDQKKKGK